MNYPNNIKKKYIHTINYKNRGMDLEELINDACKYYLDNDIAIIYKKPTPIGIVEVDYSNMTINKAYFKEPSTLDYNGIYQGKYIEFDAKECHQTTSFPLKNIHEHQLIHIKRIIKHKGIAFLIIYMNNEYFLLKGEDLLEFVNHFTRKSIPYSYIKEKGIVIKYNYNIGLDYLKGIDKAYKGVNHEKERKEKEKEKK